MSAGTLALTGYVAALLAFAAAAVCSLTGRDRVARYSLAAALVALGLTAAVRWIQTGHPPIFGTHENAIASAWALALTALLMSRDPERGDGPVPPALLSCLGGATLVFGLFFERELYPLTISERSLWVDVHVAFAWWAYAELIAAVATGVAVLAGRGGEGAERRQIRRLGVGFAAFTCMLAVGSYYSFLLFSDWYQWEMVESLAAASWLGCGIAIHARLFWGWRGRKLAGAVVALLPLVLLTFWVWSLFSGTYHYFEIPAITPGGY